jgi:thiol-disulfide isomerase/thioredoxin
VFAQERFDELAKGLATNRLSRGRVIKSFAVGLLLTGPLGALWGREASAQQPGTCSVASRCPNKEYCSADKSCICVQSAEGDIRCGEIPSCAAKLCQSSADCADLGEGYFCDTPNTGCCTDPPAEQTRCIAPCEAPPPCPPERVCGAECCAEGQSCINGVCSEEPPIPCADDPVTSASLNAASSALAAGATQVNLSPKGCMRYHRTLKDNRVTSEELTLEGKPVMLLFTDPGCGPCNAMLPEVSRWQEEHADKLTLALISRGEVEENKTRAQEHGLRNVLLQKDWEVSGSYEVRGTPSAVLISPDGKVATPVAGGAEGVRGLLSYAVGERTQLPMQPHQPQGQGQPCPNCGKVHAAAPTVPAAQEVGEEAPEVKLPDLEGNTVELANFRGEETLVLFWNPGCGFCQQMLPDLKEWEAEAPKGAPRLVVVSAGSEEANREMGLVSPVLLDQQFATGRAFGASGTPSAVLVDSEGKVASEVAVGAPAVLELAGADKTTT